MAKTSKKKSYTEDVVLNKIFKDISEEKSEEPSTSTEENTYEDDLVKFYRKKDVEERRQRYISIVKILTILFILIFLIYIFTNYIDTIADEPTQVKKTIISVPIPQAKVEKVSKPIDVEAVKIESKETIHFKIEPKKITPVPSEQPLKKVKTDRELAKENLFRQMNN